MTMTDGSAGRLAERFRALHGESRPLLLPNPWDPGSARLLEALGFSALGTTSLGLALSLGRRRADRSAVLDNCAAICAATRLPVTADLENGFGHTPEAVAECVGLAADAGAVGVSIEDSTGDARLPLYDVDHAVERIVAAIAAAQSQPGSLVVTARAEGLAYGQTLESVIRRLKAFEEAGADVLYAPYVRDLESMRTIVAALNKPVNVVMGFADPAITLEQLAGIGVARVSIGGALARLALAAFLEGAAAMRRGEFGFIERIAPLDGLFDAFSANGGDEHDVGAT
jgi:2-methylisocitrate lyase-like PEP mutase family enzyme